MKNKENTLLATPYLVWMCGFIVIPLALVIYYAFTTKAGAFTLENVGQILLWENYKPLVLALLLSLASTVLCFVFAFPLALILRNKKIGKGSFVAFIFILPMWMNSLLRILAWQTLLERKGVLNEILLSLHLPRQNLINTPYAIILGMVYDFLPFMILPIYNTLSKIDDNTIDAAYDLGASQFQMFKEIMLPYLTPSIIAGYFMAFTYSLDDFAVTFFVTGNGFSTLSVEIYSRARKGISLEINALSALVFLFSIILVVGYYFISREKEEKA